MLRSPVLECCGVLRLVKEFREVGKFFALFATGMVMIECANHNNGCCRVLKYLEPALRFSVVVFSRGYPRLKSMQNKFASLTGFACGASLVNELVIRSKDLTA